jgi:hypothetical protein
MLHNSNSAAKHAKSRTRSCRCACTAHAAAAVPGTSTALPVAGHRHGGTQACTRPQAGERQRVQPGRATHNGRTRRHRDRHHARFTGLVSTSASMRHAHSKHSTRPKPTTGPAVRHWQTPLYTLPPATWRYYSRQFELPQLPSRLTAATACPICCWSRTCRPQGAATWVYPRRSSWQCWHRQC